MNNNVVNSIANYFLILVFVFLIPFEEWPDTNTYFVRDYFYSNYLNSMINFFDIKIPNFDTSSSFKFFSDKYIFNSNASGIYINIFKIPIAFSLLFIINFYSHKYLRGPIIFSPVFIFSILSISNEPFAITLITVAFIMSMSKKIYLPIFLSVLAVLIDRSMVTTFLGLLIYLSVINLSSNFIKISFIIIISIFFTILLLIISYLNIPIINNILLLFGISDDVIIYNQLSGQNNIPALIASVSGLYGWMSLRPSPWFLYYPLVFVLFLVGILSSDSDSKFTFVCFLIPIIFTLILLPPLSQARYFPVFTILCWQSIMLGSKKVFGDIKITILLVTIMTMFGLYPLFNE